MAALSISPHPLAQRNLERISPALPPQAHNLTSAVLFLCNTSQGRTENYLTYLTGENLNIPPLVDRVSYISKAEALRVYNEAANTSFHSWLEVTGLFLSTPKNLEMLLAIVQSIQTHARTWQLQNLVPIFEKERTNLERIETLIVEKHPANGKSLGEMSLTKNELIDLQEGMSALYRCLSGFLSQLFLNAQTEDLYRRSRHLEQNTSSSSIPGETWRIKYGKFLFTHPYLALSLSATLFCFLHLYLIPLVSKVVFGSIFTFLSSSTSALTAQLSIPFALSKLASGVGSTLSFIINYQQIAIFVNPLNQLLLNYHFFEKQKYISKLVYGVLNTLIFPTQIIISVVIKSYEKLNSFQKPSRYRSGSFAEEFYQKIRLLMKAPHSTQERITQDTNIIAQWHAISMLTLDNLFKRAEHQLS